MPVNIDFHKVDFIDKQFIHKKKEENVHVYNLRRVIPRIINASLFENDLLDQLTKEEKNFLTTYYIKRNIIINGKSKNYYILRSLPFKISFADMENFLSQESIKDDSRNFMLNFYNTETIEGYYVLNKSFNEEFDEHKISKILKTRILLITDKEKVKIAELLEKCGSIEKRNIFYANMHVNPEHSYFFEHKLDHVPGMLVIETARQLATAAAHIYGKVPTSGVFFSLKRINVDFKEYLWLSFPIRVRLEMSDLNLTREGYWFKSKCLVSFHQEFREKAFVTTEAMTIKMDLMEKITTKKQVDAALEFNAYPGLQSDVVIHDTATDNNYIGTIVDISPKHFMVEFVEEIDLGHADQAGFTISLDGQFTTYGSCQLRIMQRKENRSIANFLITEINKESGKNINEIIVRLCHIREQRGIL